MSGEVLINAEQVSKKFCRSLKRSLWYGVQDIAAEVLGRNGSSPGLRQGEFWAVRDVSFEVRRGECLGLIGRNGAGKSTLLKMLNGLIKPDLGHLTIKGRVGALIELGAGFNPILTGRENIYINGAILGLSKAEIGRKFDDIVEFSEIGDFLETPVQNYSSGMKVRLGFAIAAQVEPDVLLIDEVLAVGDVGFRAKCFNAITEISKKAAVIFVSHQMPQVARVSSDVLVMNLGKEYYYGNDVPRGIEYYYELFESEKTIIAGSDKAHLHDMRLYSNKSVNTNGIPRISYSEDLFIELLFTVSEEVERFSIHLGFSDRELRTIAQCFSRNAGHHFINQGQNMRVLVRIPNLMFTAGNYSITVAFVEGTGEDGRGEILARYQSMKEFRVIDSKIIGFAPIMLNAEWVCEINRDTSN